MTEESNILPCPCCGKAPHIEYVKGYYWIACRCGLCSGQLTDHYRVIENWNTRTPLPLGKVEKEDGEAPDVT